MNGCSCTESGILIIGVGFFETTRVALCIIDPKESLAMIAIANPVTISAPTSFEVGVPDRVRLLLSRDNHLGPAERVYVIGRVDEKVEDENV